VAVFVLQQVRHGSNYDRHLPSGSQFSSVDCHTLTQQQQQQQVKNNNSNSNNNNQTNNNPPNKQQKQHQQANK
jgi:hypothetical protein